MKIASILLIEDDELTASLYHLVLNDLNVCEEIIIKTDAEEGFKFILDRAEANNSPDVILIDLKMPGLDGFELIEKINRLKKIKLFKSKIIILTSSSFHKDINKAKELKVDDYLLKPLTKEKIQAILRKYFS